MNKFIRNYWKALSAIFAVILIAGSVFFFVNKQAPSATPALESADAVRAVDIIELSDYHGEMEATNGYPVASAMYSLIKKITDKNPNGSLVLGVGDLFDNPPMSRELGGIPTRKILERFGMEAAAIGNHEFYWGDMVFSTTMKNSAISFLSANMFNKSTGKLVYEPYKIFDKNGVKIAVIGAAGAPVISAIKDRAPNKYSTTDTAQAVNKYAEEIKTEKKADVIIALVHDGGTVSSSGVKSGSLFDLAKTLKNIDILYGGHSHKIFVSKENGIHVLNAGSYGRGFIHTKISIAGEGAPPEIANQYISIGDIEGDPNAVVRDPDIESIIEKAKKDTKNVYSEIIGSADKRITKSQWSAPYGESELGNWVTDALRIETSSDVGLHSNGNLGYILKGSISTGSLFFVSKKNSVVTVALKKSELKEILEDAFRDEDKVNKKAKGDGIQASGIKIKYDMNRPNMNRIVDITYEDGTPIDNDKILKVALNGRMIEQSESKFIGFKKPEYKYTDTNIAVYKILADYLRKSGGVIRIEKNKRIENVNGGDVIVDDSGELEEDGEDEE